MRGFGRRVKSVLRPLPPVLASSMLPTVRHLANVYILQKNEFQVIFVTFKSQRLRPDHLQIL